MEELILSVDALKQELMCSFCSNLVCKAFKFVECSHIFCHKHLENSQMKECFTCHKGNIKNMAPDNDADQLVEDCRQLSCLFSGKENVDTHSNINTPTKVSTRLRSKSGGNSIPSKVVTRVSPSKSIDSDTITNFKSGGRKVRNKQINNVENNILEKKTKSAKSKPIPEKSKTVDSYLIKPVNLKEASETFVNKPTDGKSKGGKSEIRNKKSSISNDSLSEISFSMGTSKDIMKRNKKGETYLHSACVQNQLEKVKALLEQGATPNTKDNAGWTPLHEAVASNNQAVVEILLNHRAIPHVPGPHYETPLHEAVRLQFIDIVKLLVSAGANIHAKNDKGETPLTIASDDVKKILQSTHSDLTTKPCEISFYIQSDNELVILPVLLKKEHSTKLQKLVKAHSNLKSVGEFSKNVTHVLVEMNDGSNQLTQETLLAVVSGIPIISSEWISASNATTLMDVNNYYVTNIGGPAECVHLSLINKQSLMPGLFTGCHFYILGFSSKYEISAHLHIKKQFLCQLITQGGGVILRREPNPESIPENERVLPFHAAPGSPLENCAHYIIYQNCPAVAYNMKHVKSLPVAWLIECVQHFKLVDP